MCEQAGACIWWPRVRALPLPRVRALPRALARAQVAHLGMSAARGLRVVVV